MPSPAPAASARARCRTSRSRGTAKSQQDAIDITNSTALAFKKWFEQQQVESGTKVSNRVLVEQVNSAETATAQGGSKPLLGVAAAALVLLGAAGFALALERLIPRRSKRPQRVAAAAEPQEVARPAGEPELPLLEVPTMTFGAQVEDVAGGEKKKPAPRPRKGTGSNGSNGTAAPRRRRTPASTPRVAPSTDDAV